MLILLAAATMVMAVFDCWFTIRRILKYGMVVEMNPVIAALYRFTNGYVDISVFVGTVVVSGLVCSLLVWANQPLLLAFVAGARAMLTRLQLSSLRLEKVLEERRSTPSTAGAPSLPDDSDDDQS